jgi:hypothetical protein
MSSPGLERANDMFRRSHNWLGFTRCMILVVTIVCIGQMGAEPMVFALNLTPSPAVAPGVDAFPRLAAAPGDRAANRINLALSRADERVRSAVKECRQSAQEGLQPGETIRMDWTRAISVTMRGPHFLSLVAADSWQCGGMYPNDEQFALVYDLTTGAPVNWSRPLPAALVRETSRVTAEDGTVVGTVSSPELHGLYFNGVYSCKTLADPGLAFTIWPDARTAGIAIQPFQGFFPHVDEACAVDWTIPLSVLRKLGVRHELMDAIEEAHRQGLYDSQQ